MRTEHIVVALILMLIILAIILAMLGLLPDIPGAIKGLMNR